VKIDELLETLRQLDEVTLLEILDLHSDEIVNRFEDVIKKRYNEITAKVEEPVQYQIREEERYEPLSGQLSWNPPHQETYDADDSDN